MELASTLQPVKFPTTAKLLSFNAVNMFTRIPVDHSISIMVELLEKNNILLGRTAEFRDLLPYCTERKLCVFQGSNMLMAYVCMDKLLVENEILQSNAYGVMS